MSGKRLVVTVILLVVLAGLAITAVLVGSDDDGDTTATTIAPGPVADEDVAATLLPAVGALGPEWVETVRDDEPSEAAIESGDACPSGPVPEGFLIRSEQQRVEGSTIVESLSVTAGVVAEGAEPADLDDPAVVSCLLDALQAQVPTGSTVAAVEGPVVDGVPEGATVAHQRYEVTGAGGTGGTFDFVLVRRGRVVSLGLLSGFDPTEHTPLGDVVAVLDRPLVAAATRLG